MAGRSIKAVSGLVLFACIGMSSAVAAEKAIDPVSKPILLAQATAPAKKPDEANSAAKGTPAQQKNWLVSCGDSASDGGVNCRMIYNLVVKETGQRLLTVVIQKSESAKAPRIVLGLPHGVLFPKGVDYSIDDGEAQNMAVQTSDADGAYAASDLDEKLLQALRTGKALKIGFASAAGKSVTIPVSLDGFAAAYKRVSAFGG